MEKRWAWVFLPVFWACFGLPLGQGLCPSRSMAPAKWPLPLPAQISSLLQHLGR